jgi:hypothetical protein
MVLKVKTRKGQMLVETADDSWLLANIDDSNRMNLHADAITHLGLKYEELAALA